MPTLAPERILDPAPFAPPTPPAPDPRRSRVALTSLFFIGGVMAASWVPHVATVQALHQLDPGTLGTVLLCRSAGSALALPVCAWLLARFCGHRLCAILGTTVPGALLLPIFAPGPALLAAALFLYGASFGGFNLVLNHLAVRAERNHDHPIMSSFHAAYSLGLLAGSLAALALLHAGLSAVHHLALVAALLAALSALCLRGLDPAPPAPRHPATASWRFPREALLALSAIAFCDVITEGSMGDWSAVYLVTALAVPAAFAGAGFTAYSLCMAAGRLMGDALVCRLGPAATLRLSGGLAASGVAVVLLGRTPAAALIGFALVGLGVANVFPVLISSAGRLPGVDATVAVATVLGCGTISALASPAVIGWTARLTSLPQALGLLVISMTVVALLAGFARPPRQPIAPIPLPTAP